MHLRQQACECPCETWGTPASCCLPPVSDSCPHKGFICSTTCSTPACSCGGGTLAAAHHGGPCRVCSLCAPPAHTVLTSRMTSHTVGPVGLFAYAATDPEEQHVAAELRGTPSDVHAWLPACATWPHIAGSATDGPCRTPACQAHQQVPKRSAPLQVGCLRRRWEGSDSGPLAPKDLAKAVLMGRPPSRQELSASHAGRQQLAWGAGPEFIDCLRNLSPTSGDTSCTVSHAGLAAMMRSWHLVLSVSCTQPAV